MKNKVLVIGGAGFLGSYVVNELEKLKYDVVATDLKVSSYINPLLFRKCDILDIESITSILDEGFDFVFNFAGFANLDDAIDNPFQTINLNVMGNLNVLEACKSNNISRYIYASSAYAMNEKGSFYGISKLTSEKLVEEYYKKYGMKYTIIRYGSVYSERNFYNNYIYALIKKMITEKQIIHEGDGEEIRDYIHAYDAAKLSIEIIEDPKFENEHIILTGTEKMTRKALFEMIKEILNEDIKIQLLNNGYANHYKLSPYSFHPTLSKKMIANPFIDMGQGILECIKEVHKELLINDED